MEIEKLYQDYGIKTESQGGKHSHEGWIQTECPWCTGNPGYHLGII